MRDFQHVGCSNSEGKKDNATTLLREAYSLCTTVSTLKRSLLKDDSKAQGKFSAGLELLKTQLQKVQSRARGQDYTTVCLIGRSGSGKTHLLNWLLRHDFDSKVEPALTEQKMKESLTVTVLDSFDESIYWTPQLFHLGSSLGTSDKQITSVLSTTRQARCQRRYIAGGRHAFALQKYLFTYSMVTMQE